MSEEIKAYREEKQEIKDLKMEQLEEEDRLEDDFERKMQELKEEYRNAKEGLKEKHKDEREEKQSQLGKDKAAAFRERIGQEAKTEDVETENNDRNNTEQQDLESPQQDDDELEV